MCGVHKCTCIKAFKIELAWDKVKWFRVTSNIMLLKTVTKELKNKAILNLKQYCNALLCVPE